MMVLFIMLCAVMGYSTPTWMWIGTYDIDNNPCNYGGLDAIVTGNSFFNGALSRHPNGPTPNRYINYTEKQVCPNNINSSSRELCDFIFVGSHGSPLGQAIWNNSGTTCAGWFSTLQNGVGGGDPYATAMNLGTNYVRWAYFCGCHVLKNPPTPVLELFTSWAPAFQGVQCIFGYASTGYLWNGITTNQVDEFWQLWTGRYSNGSPIPGGPIGMWLAHSESTGDQVYQAGGLSITPAVISGASVPYGPYYCNFTYNNATSVKAPNGFSTNGGVYGYTVFGSPN
jgi:hypothetical protein